MYLSDVCENLGSMFEYAVACGYSPVVYWKRFVNSVVAQQIEKGNPKFLTGYSGRDLTGFVINIAPIRKNKISGHLMNRKEILSFDEYYWAGWAIAHLQYETGYSFFHIEKHFPIKKVLELYSPLHEADITKFLDIAKTYLTKEKERTNLKQIRMASGLSQTELSKQSGVELRSIQMYEQKRNDINKAQVETLLKLSKVLGCNIEDLLE